MTVSEMADALFDKLGITAASAPSGTVTTIFRLLNQAKDRFVEQNKWSFLESSEDQLWTTSQRVYSMPAIVSHIVGLEQADGTKLEETERMAYDELFRAESDTATAPARFTQQGTDGNSLIQIHVYPNPTTNTTGSVRHLVRVADIDNSGSTASYAHIPENHHYLIVALAESEFARFEDSDQLQIIEGNAEQASGEVVQSHVAPVADDGTR